ncbi:hypothetical protein MVEN_00478800 [Mycena venus]|uniref:Uncharacterized protein n=1 Tax=Mycena venus TaxID=2733690 RepID=A0A8H6YVL0_9AGAR|nr:hypothetical protein MVEN_00478800 [Mycena venus]
MRRLPSSRDARGVGNEFLLSCDLRCMVGSPGVLLSQLDNGLGAGGSIYLSHLIGRGRAFEYLLFCADVDARPAERVGWANRAFRTRPSCTRTCNNLQNALRCLFPAAGIVKTKQGINATSRSPTKVIIEDAQDVIVCLVSAPEGQAIAEKFIKATNNQSSVPLELNYGEEIVNFYKN